MNNKTSCKDFTAKEESRLTDAEILEIGLELFGDENDGPTLQQSMKFARAIEAKLKEKNEH
jgi:hypothetical protein